MAITHAKVSAKADGSDPSLILPSDWNDDHVGTLPAGSMAHSDLTGLTVGDDHTQYQKESEKGAANGYAALDSGILVPIAQLPTGTGASQVALGNHTHAGASGGTPAVVLGSAAAAGSASTFLRTDDTIAAFDATVPTTLTVAGAAATGSAAKAARRDHGHGMPGAFVASGGSHAAGFVPDPGASSGTTKFLREDATFAVPPGTGNPVASDTIWDAKGDLAVATGADAASKLAVGSDGQVLTADSTQTTGVKWGAAGGGSDSRLVIAGKTADEGPLSSTSLQNDDHISFAIGANEIWAVYLYLRYTETSTGNMKWDLTGPAGITSEIVGNSATFLDPVSGGADRFVSSEALTGGAGGYQRRGFIINSSTAGTVQLRWAQNTASGALTVKKGVHLIAYKIA